MTIVDTSRDRGLLHHKTFRRVSLFGEAGQAGRVERPRLVRLVRRRPKPLVGGWPQNGFVSGGGGTWYSRTLVNLPVGARVNVYIPQHGYVAVGQTLAEAKRFDQADVRIDGSWVSLKDQKLGVPTDTAMRR